MMTDGLLTEEQLREALGETPFKFFPQCESTMDIARQWALEGAPEGAVVIAEEQTAGRGRFGRAWHAPAGSSLMFSAILRPVIQAEWLHVLSMAAALCVRNCINEQTPICTSRLALKWPNDVLIDRRKVAGILAEAVWEEDRLNSVIVGIGLNVYTDFAGTPLFDTATSLIAALNETEIPTRTALLHHILNGLVGLSELASAPQGPSRIFEEWSRHIITLGEMVRVTNLNHHEVIEGIATKLDAQGALHVTDRQGIVHRVLAGDVTLSDARDDYGR
jgi:BirA family biotin operon repressor/biotin-[acetyl-CoA-carboxylase] ligase